jgi:hypothetical protein
MGIEWTLQEADADGYAGEASNAIRPWIMWEIRAVSDDGLGDLLQAAGGPKAHIREGQLESRWKCDLEAIQCGHGFFTTCRPWRNELERSWRTFGQGKNMQ